MSRIKPPYELFAVFSLAMHVGLGCSRPSSLKTLVCADTRKGHRLYVKTPWVLRIDEAQKTAELVVHVPAESVRDGVPKGNRLGRVHVTERAYEVIIPADSGDKEKGESWARMQLAFEIDRFTGLGTVEWGERKYGETIDTPVRCQAGPESPRI